MAGAPVQRSVAPAPPLTIGGLAREAGVAVSTVRFYERQGILEPEDRSAAGYRRYTPEAVRRVRFIRRSQSLGFTLREAHDVLRLADDPDRIVLGDVAAQVGAKIAEIDDRIADLVRVRDALTTLVDSAPVHPHCPVIEAIVPAGEETRDPGESANRGSGGVLGLST